VPNNAIEQQDLRRRLGFYTGMRLLLALLFLGILALLVFSPVWTGMEPQVYSYLVAITFLVLGLSAAGLAGATNLTRFTYLQLLADTAIITAVVSQTGGVESIFGVLYFLSIVASAYLVTRNGALLVAAWNVVALLSSAGIQMGPEALVAPHYQQLLVKVLGFFMVALLAGELSQQLHDTGRQLQREEAYSKAVQQELAQVVQTIRSGLAILGPDGVVRSANPMAVQIFPALAHQPASEVVPDYENRHQGMWEVQTRSDTGEAMHVIVTFNPLEDGGGVLVMEDVTSLREIEHLVRKEERFTAVGNLAASIAHEIRNPLASLSGAMQLIQPAEGEEELYAIVQREVRRLNEMVTRFLQSTRSSAFHPVPTDLEELVKQVVETFGKDPQYQEMVQVDVEFEDLAPFMLDREQMRQVLWNLLLNAAQAMPEGGQIRVTGHRIGERLRLVVTDQGIGVEPENLERLFDPFYTTRVGGTGLGLATVERHVREHKGEVWVQSEVGQGTTFAVWLPVAAPKAAVKADEERAHG